MARLVKPLYFKINQKLKEMYPIFSDKDTITLKDWIPKMFRRTVATELVMRWNEIDFMNKFG